MPKNSKRQYGTAGRVLKSLANIINTVDPEKETIEVIIKATSTKFPYSDTFQINVSDVELFLKLFHRHQELYKQGRSDFWWGEKHSYVFIPGFK